MSVTEIFGVPLVSLRGGLSKGPLVVNLGQVKILYLSSGMVILLAGLVSKILRRIKSSSGDRGRIVLKKPGSLRKARKVLSLCDARFHGFRPQVKLTRMTPKDQMSLGADA